VQKFKDKVRETRDNANRTITDVKYKANEQIRNTTDQVKYKYEEGKNVAIRSYENVKPVIEQYGSEAVQQVTDTYEKYGPQVGSVIVDAYQKYGTEIATELKATYDKYGPEIGNSISSSYYKYGPLIGEKINEAYNKYGENLGQKLTSCYDQYGPIIGESIRETYEKYGPKVGNIILSNYNQYGPVIGMKIQNAYTRYGEDVASNINLAYHKYGPEIGNSILSTYNNYGPKIGGFIHQKFTLYGEKVGMAIIAKTESTAAVLKNPDTYAIAVGITLAVCDQTGFSTSVDQLCTMVQNSRLSISYPEGMDELGSRFTSLYTFASLDKEMLVHRLKVIDGCTKTIDDEIKSSTIFETGNINKCLKLLSHLESTQNELRNAEGNLKSMKLVNIYL
jgi:hypothetical protein